MLQKKYLCKDITSAHDAISDIGNLLSERDHKCALLGIYVTGFAGPDISALVDKARLLGHPELLIAGISTTVTAELMPEGTGIMLNLILTEDADIDVEVFSCVPGEEDKAAGKLKRKLDETDHVRAVELFGSNMALKMTLFIEKGMEGHEDVVLFGTATIRNLPQRVSVDEEENCEVEQVEKGETFDEFVIGNKVLYDGFVTVIYSGDTLEVQADYALGWNPIGRKLSVTLGPDPSKGETVVTAINDRKAVDIYREYLGVYPDKYLIGNICEFPLVVERSGINICLIPIDCGKDGELYFMMTLHEDEQLRFTFASHDEVLDASRRSLEHMENFCPDALFLIPCGNRISFLKEDAHIEWDEFETVAPDYALIHGACELFYHKGQGGILNSAHLAIGLREGQRPDDVKTYEHPTLESMRHGHILSLSDRMSVFLSKITTELLETVEEARNANNAKSTFLSHMSHEIRTPINAILGMDEMILQESNEDNIIEYAESMHSAGNNLLGIVNDILDFSKIEAGKMRIVPAEYELSSVINDLYNIVRLRAEDKGLTVIPDVDPDLPSVLFGDEMRIKQIITNMLTNAVKYTEKGSVTLGIKRALCDPGNEEEDYIKACPGDDRPPRRIRLEVFVEDTGIGIKQENMEKLFAEYERFDEKRNRKVEGTGLGLSITTQLLDLMGSTLSVQSTYGEGSRFSFTLVQGIVNDEPVKELIGKLKHSAGVRKHVSFTAEDARILVVDDSAVNLTVIRNLLKRTKIRIDTAGSGQEALQLVRDNEYDVIFLDHMMPDMDGPETLAKMKEMEDNRSLNSPVICLTANASSTAREEYIGAGFRDYLSKPIMMKELEELLFNHIQPEKIRTV